MEWNGTEHECVPLSQYLAVAPLAAVTVFVGMSHLDTAAFSVHS